MASTPYDGRSFAAFLFDMDGTLLSSIASAERVWTCWARGHGLDVATFLPTIHGIRAVETIRRLDLPGVDAEAEAARIMQAEIEDLAGIEALPGAPEFLAGLPASRYAIVTSAPRPLAKARLAAAGLPVPKTLLAAEDVVHGKPDPECYRKGAEWLGVPPASCLVFEDAPAGIAAGEAAGAAVAIVTATHDIVAETRHPTLRDYDGLEVVVSAEGLALRRTGP